MAGILRTSLIVATTSALIAPVAVGTAQAAPRQKSGSSAPVVVVSGLNNPRQLSLVNDGVLLVAEAGKGGDLATVTDPEGGTQGLGYTGSVSAVFRPARAHNQHPFRIVKGLLSAAAAEDSDEGPKGGGATGPDGVSATSLRRIAVIETTFGPEVPPAAEPRDGHLLLTKPFGTIRPFADITQFEADHDPDGMGIDSNPYAVLAYRGGWLVADAAGNDVLWVNRHGDISVFRKFANVTTGPCAGQFDPAPPFVGCHFVPTSLASDRWGNVYVGGLSSLIPGQARVVKLDRHGHTLKVWSGFSAVTGVAVGRDGALYVSQLFADPATPGLPGVLTRIKGSQRTNVDVPFPAGVAVDKHNNVFVSAFSLSPDTGGGIPGIDSSGQVWRLRFAGDSDDDD
jgi:hypothetical protein